MAKQKIKKVKALVIQGFTCKISGNEYRKNQVVEVCPDRFRKLKGKFLVVAPADAQVTVANKKGCGCPC